MVKIIALSKGKERNVSTIEATFSTEDGQLIPLRVKEDDKPELFIKIQDVIKNSQSNISEAASKLFSLMSPQALVTEHINSSSHLSRNMKIKDGNIYFGEFKLEETLSNHLLSLLNEENTPKDEKLWKSYMMFLDNLYQNANEDIRNQLFRWMDYENGVGNSFGITDDGCIIGYKGCAGTILEPISVQTGFAIVDGVEVNGHIPNKVGSVIQMPRSTVQNDPSVGCSYGLHVGTRDYASRWAPILLLVKVNPRDVVSVPYECESQKMRVCEYTVLEVTDIEQEHKMYHSSDDNYDDDDCIYDLFDDDDDDFLEYEEFELEDDSSYGALDEDEAVELESSDETIYVEFNGEKAVGTVLSVNEDSETGELSIELVNDKFFELLNDKFLKEIKLKDITEYVKEEYDSISFDDIFNLLEKRSEIKVNYDGKTFIGSIVDVYFKTDCEPGIIMKGEDGNHKHIKLHRIESWECLSEDEDDEEYEGELDIDEALKLKEDGDLVEIHYDGKTFTGTIVNVVDTDNPGIVVKSPEGDYKHIKLHRIQGFLFIYNKDELVDDTCCSDENPCDKDCCEKSKVFKKITSAKIGSLVEVRLKSNHRNIPELKFIATLSSVDVENKVFKLDSENLHLFVKNIIDFDSVSKFTVIS